MTSYKLWIYYEQSNAGEELKYDCFDFENYYDALKYANDRNDVQTFEIFKIQMSKNEKPTKTLEIRTTKFLPKWFIKWRTNKE